MSTSFTEYYEKTIQIQNQEIKQLKKEIEELRMKISELNVEIDYYKADAADAVAEANWNDTF